MRVQKPKKIKRSALEKTRTVLGEKIRESAVSVLPILVIVVILCLCIVPMRTDLLLTFLIGALLLTVGMGLFSLGAEQSMTLIGRPAVSVRRSRKRKICRSFSAYRFFSALPSPLPSPIFRCSPVRCRTLKRPCFSPLSALA